MADPKPVTVKCVEAGGQRLYIGGSDGALRLYEVNEVADEQARAGAPTTPSSRSARSTQQVRTHPL